MKKKLMVAGAVLMTCVLTFTGGMAMANPRSPRIFVNGSLVPTEAFIDNGRTFVPLSAIGNMLGATVSWDEAAYAVNIQSEKSSHDAMVSNVIQSVSPSVVGIVGNYTASATGHQDKYMEGLAHGTGVIIKSGGEILTNAHVVENLTNIVVVLHNGSAYNAKVKYIDRPADLAVLKIDKIGLPVVTFANDADAVVGETVVAIGTPLSFSLRNSASKGIISGLNRGVYSEYALIQTDASINAGNSGGPLVNLNGQVVGINSSKFAGLGVEGMGFSIPADTVKYVLDQFEKYGKVNRPKISATLEEGWAAKRGLPSSDGLTVLRVEGKAAAEGLMAGDVILAINNIPLHSMVDLNESMKKYNPGDVASVKIRRGGEERTISLTLE